MSEMFKGIVHFEINFSFNFDIFR